MSNTVANVLATMGQGPTTLGWDVLVVHDAGAINKLFAQQYVANLATEQNFAPITHTFTPVSGVTVQFNNLVLGPPLISFAPGLDPQEAIVQMPFIAGEITITNSSGQSTYVSGYQNITETNSYTLQMVVMLTQVQGQIIPPNQTEAVTANQVVVQLNNANTFKANVISNSSGSGYLDTYFSSLFQSETSASLQYVLGALVLGSSENLIPTSFDIRTLTSSDSDGAVLLLVHTTYHETGGNLPGSNFPDLLPSGFDCAVVVANNTLFGNILEDQLASTLQGSPQFAVAGAGNSFNSLELSGGGYPAPSVTVSSNGVEQWGHISTGPMTIPYSGMGFKAENDLLTISWVNSFKQHYDGMQYETNGRNGYNGSHVSGSVSVGLSANYSAALTLTSSGSVCFRYQTSGSANVTANGNSGWLTPRMAYDMPGPIQTAVQTAAQGLSRLMLPEVNAFAVEHLLFPTQNVLQIAEAHLPGDMALFGQLQPTETAFALTPLSVVLASGQTQQFAASNSSTAVWNVNGSSSSAGVITQNGFYTAPSVTVATPVIVTAREGSDVTTAAVVVVPNAFNVSPAYALVSSSSAGATQPFAAGYTGSSPQEASWSVAPDDGTAGTINPNTGLYTAPDTFTTGVVTATITATFPTGSATALVCLVDATFAFSPTPAMASLGPNATQQFSAGSGNTVAWSVLPSGLGQITSDGLYTAPQTIAQPTTAVILADKDVGSLQLVGVAVVSLNPSST